jgi:1-acyl-sn-glycerol-3-phosphate acyltransferase
MLLYNILKIWSRSVIPLYCRKISIRGKEQLKEPGPLLIACNHPNSFLDGIVLSTLFKQPLHSLARGDAFYNRFFARILYSLGMLPVYRLREGADKLEENYGTFVKCKEIFKKKGVVLIFSEGLCINEWKLRKLKKGTARLALESWQEGIPLKVLPVGINYQSFRSVGKNIVLNIGNPILTEAVSSQDHSGESINQFNRLLDQELRKLVIEVDSNNKGTLRSEFEVPVSSLRKILLFIPALVGVLLHLPLYITLRLLTDAKAKHSDHRDAILHSLLMLAYPAYVILMAIMIYWQTNYMYALASTIAIPFTAWSAIQLKPQF